jgi:hypothetical protein
LYGLKGVEEEVKEEMDDLEEVDEDVKIVEVNGSDEEAEKSAESEVLTGAERACLKFLCWTRSSCT